MRPDWLILHKKNLSRLCSMCKGARWQELDVIVLIRALGIAVLARAAIKGNERTPSVLEREF